MSCKLFVVAGEPSGDAIGAAFLERLRPLREFTAVGVGGVKLQAAGLVSIFPMEQLSVMGFVDVALRLPFLLFRIEQTVRRIIIESPDLVLLIDSQVFSAMVAKKLRARGYAKAIVLYVAPAVWAWKPERAPGLKKLYTEVLSVLPFEPAVMQKLGGPSTFYVGHPATDRKDVVVDAFRPGQQGEIALLPGSRSGELRRHLPLFREVAERLAQHPAVSGFVLPTLPGLADNLRRKVSEWRVNVDVVCDEPQRRERLGHSVAALASAGTITLELALMKVPHVGTYVPDYWQMKAFEKADRPMISLANNLLGRALIPEIFPGENLVERLSAGLVDLLENQKLRQSQLDGFDEIRHRMEHGDDEVGRYDAVDRIMTYLPTPL